MGLTNKHDPPLSKVITCDPRSMNTFRFLSRLRGLASKNEDFMKTVLITGSNGFVGRNLSVTLSGRSDLRVSCFDVDSEPASLAGLVGEADFIFHLAGVNRPQN